MPRPRKRQTPDEAIVSVNADDSNDAGNVDVPQPRQRRARKPRSKTREINEQQLEALHDKLAGATYMLLAHALPVSPTTDEMDSFFIPLERIGLRHMPEPFKNATPDQKDASLALLALAKYTARGYIVPAVLGQAMRQAQPSKRPQPTPVPTPAPTPTPASTPPEQQTPAPVKASTRKSKTPTSKNEAAGYAEAINSEQQPNEQLRNLHGYLTAFTPETGE